MIMLSENSSYGSAYLAEATSVDQLPGLFGHVLREGLGVWSGCWMSAAVENLGLWSLGI